jgi:hypothetical protein
MDSRFLHLFGVPRSTHNQLLKSTFANLDTAQAKIAGEGQRCFDFESSYSLIRFSAACGVMATWSTDN